MLWFSFNLLLETVLELIHKMLEFTCMNKCDLKMSSTVCKIKQILLYFPIFPAMLHNTAIELYVYVFSACAFFSQL